MSIWYKILLVALGGGVGSACRLLISTAIKPQGIWLGIATWVINTLACFIIGFCGGWLLASTRGETFKTGIALLTMTGFCGGFSTFSAFTLDSVKYIESGHIGIWIIYVTSTIFAGLFMCAAGYWLGAKLG